MQSEAGYVFGRAARDVSLPRVPVILLLCRIYNLLTLLGLSQNSLNFY